MGLFLTSLPYLELPQVEAFSKSNGSFFSTLIVGTNALRKPRLVVYVVGFADPMARSHRIGLLAQLPDLDGQIQEGDSDSQTTYNALVTQRGTTQVQLEQFWAGVKQTRNQQIQNLLNYNSGISTSLTIDGNHKSVNDIVLRFFATDTLAFSDLSVLETIAAQCPLEGGDAVYEARAMISYFTGEQFDNSACIGGGEREGKSANATLPTPITIYPNPATNMIVVQGAPENAQVNITDHLGRLVHFGSLQSNRIELTSLQNGVYTVQVFSSEKTLLTTQKLVIAN
jgi:hypothetical protein